MLLPRTLKILGALLGGFVLLAIPAYWGPSYLEEISSYVVIVSLLSIYFCSYSGLQSPGLSLGRWHTWG